MVTDTFCPQCGKLLTEGANDFRDCGCRRRSGSAALLWIGFLAFVLALIFQPRQSQGGEVDLKLVKWGVPDGTGLQRGRYLIGFDGRTRCPRWVLEHLDRSRLVARVDRDSESFRPDGDIPEEFRSTAADYRASGFDIGHMAPANNHRASQADLDWTFLFSNAAPQDPQFNRGLWRMLEAQIKETGETAPAWVVTAPLWIPTDGKLSVGTIGPHGVWIPTHCGKSVLVERNGSVELKAWILPNRDLKGEELETFEVSIDVFERAAGFDCWAELPDEQEKRLERGL